MKVLKCRYIWVFPKVVAVLTSRETEERWRQTPCDIQCVERLWQETLTAALCRSHWLLLELNPFFSILTLYNGLLPFWYISQAVPPAKMRVFMQRSAGLPDVWLALKTWTLLTMLLLCSSGNECPLLSGLPTPCKNLRDKEPTPNYTCFYF